ncbi:aconitate hydratase [Sinomonas cellulolyticus]|uniref:Aconitate hydratase AcnA n=1 Tax=Sinomonas cellulolyticus TaxID=2801916 RepID=A0ABS1JYA7_9MICC|nr:MULTISPECIES: aconitate hydratase AcnA [Sinomonas]MBL0704229.1 aconitate hydratase AcnA [Sinomonas cellulolyticus]GHG61054.1 aconitate hydratase [Sinomonas sp. KCTC 49339]
MGRIAEHTVAGGRLLDDGGELRVVDVRAAAGEAFERWPVVLRLLAENVLRNAEAGERERSLGALVRWLERASSEEEVEFLPGRVLMHDTTSTPALVDIAAMRSTVAEAGGDPSALNPLLPVEVSIDHSLAVEDYARMGAPVRNMAHEIRRNRERYRFLKWAAQSMDNVHINPPGTGIMHTINLEQLATVVTVQDRGGERWAVPDMMLGTDSHTPMVNGLGVLGWGVGGLEAQTVMFGMPTTLRIPDVVGVRLTGRLGAGALATDLALTVTHRLRELGVTGEFVEFYGPGVSALSVGERAVVANMAPEYGATTGYFPVDARTVEYLRQTGRTEAQVALVEAYMRRAGLWFDPAAEPTYTRTLEIDLSAIETSAAGPRRPQDLLPVSAVPAALAAERRPSTRAGELPEFPVAIAAITSCTNTTDPRLLVAAGLLARRARAFELSVPEWVKTSLAPGSPAAASYLRRAGLTEDLDAVGFGIVGFGCTTCIGNSGSLTQPVAQALEAAGSRPVAILSGNRNFPGRVHPDLDLGFLMSPPMVIAYALAGDAAKDLSSAPVQRTADGRDVYLADLWPDAAEIDAALASALDPADFARDFRVASENRLWADIEAPTGDLFPWDESSTILRRPPFASLGEGSLLGEYTAHPLLVLGDDVTTDHISPASAIPRDSAVADFLVDRGEDRNDLNVFASRRGNWEVMVRGAFHSKTLRNGLAPQAPTAHTTYGPTGELMPLWDAALRYRADGESVVVIGGERYGMGSSRDWAAKAQRLLGARAVLADSFERIHRSNLIGMGILPLLIPAGVRGDLQGMAPGDTLHIDASPGNVRPTAPVAVSLLKAGQPPKEFTATAAVETAFEAGLLAHGGVIPAILAQSTQTA